jgi:fructose-bisphosphate aldolase class II
MLVNMVEMLKDAEKHNYAIGSFNAPNLTTLRAIIAAAEELDCPVMINHAQGHEPVVQLEVIAPLMKEYAEKAKVPVCMHIDHGHDLAFCIRAVKAGFTSIMYDRSEDLLEINIKKIKDFIELVKPINITVEAELGAMPNNMPTVVPGQEKSDLSDLSQYFTRVDEARRFCEETKVDALTISFGTVHGIYEKKSNLDIQRVKDIKAAISNTETSLVMHGASGTEPNQVIEAIDAGIRKINYFTGMDTAVTPYFTDFINKANGKPVNFSILENIAMEVLHNKCKETMRLFLSKKK